MSEERVNHHTRQHILRAAVKCFAHSGYAAASVQQIVDTARVSKPALYYYFKDKAGLFEALVDQAHNERYRLMCEAAERGGTLWEKLEEMVAAAFDFAVRNRELVRLALASAFAASGEVPGQAKCQEKGSRNFQFLKALIQVGQGREELDSSFSAEALAMGIYGQVNTYIMVSLLFPEFPLDRKTAATIVRLFMQGATAKAGSAEGHKNSSPRAEVKKPRARGSRKKRK